MALNFEKRETRIQLFMIIYDIIYKIITQRTFYINHNQYKKETYDKLNIYLNLNNYDELFELYDHIIDLKNRKIHYDTQLLYTIINNLIDKYYKNEYIKKLIIPYDLNNNNNKNYNILVQNELFDKYLITEVTNFL
jgi:hypothetical protein